MGRALRRQLERMDRLEKRKGKLLVTPEELHQMRNENTHAASEYSVEALMTCFALAQHRLYGFGTTRIARTLEYIDQLMEAVIDDEATIEDYMQQLEEETGIQIKCAE